MHICLYISIHNISHDLKSREKFRVHRIMAFCKAMQHLRSFSLTYLSLLDFIIQWYINSINRVGMITLHFIALCLLQIHLHSSQRHFDVCVKSYGGYCLQYLVWLTCSVLTFATNFERFSFSYYYLI